MNYGYVKVAAAVPVLRWLTVSSMPQRLKKRLL